jgi:hypothetical protein
MCGIPFQRSMYHASADFAHRRMTHRSLGVGGYVFWWPTACPLGSIWTRPILSCGPDPDDPIYHDHENDERIDNHEFGGSYMHPNYPSAIFLKKKRAAPYSFSPRGLTSANPGNFPDFRLLNGERKTNTGKTVFCGREHCIFSHIIKLARGGTA